MRKTTSIASLSEFDLAVIREELAAAAEPLTEALEMPVEFLSANPHQAVYVMPDGIMTANYRIDENDIEFTDIRVWDGDETEDRKAQLGDMVAALESGKNEEADRLFENISARAYQFAQARKRVMEMVEPIQRKIDETMRQIPESARPAFAPTTPYFARKNFAVLGKLAEAAERIENMLDFGVDSSDTILEAFRYKSRGGKVRKIKINRKMRRLARKVARRNRAALVRNLKKARRQLRKVSARPSFRRRVSKVRRLNASVDIAGIQNALLEIATSQPRLAYLTTDEVERIVSEALKLDGVKNPEQNVVEETAEALVRVARELLPESKKHIVQAAAHYIRGEENVGSEDIDDAIECCLYRVYEAADAEDADKSDIAKMVKGVVDKVIDQISSDIDPDDTDQEAEDMRAALKILSGYQETLAQFIESPDEIDANRLGAIIGAMEDMFYDESEDDESEDEDSDDKEPEDDKESEDSDDKEPEDDESEDDESEDDESEDEEPEDDEDEPKDKKPSKKSKKAKKVQVEEEDEDIEIGEGHTVTAKAYRALTSLVESLKKRESCDGTEANEWCYKGRKFQFTIDESAVTDGGIFGRVHGPDGPEGTFLIERDGSIRRWPTSTQKMVEACSCNCDKGLGKGSGKGPGRARKGKFNMLRSLDADGFKGAGTDIADSLYTHGCLYDEATNTLVVAREGGFSVVGDIDPDYIKQEFSVLDDDIRESVDSEDIYAMVSAVNAKTDAFAAEPVLDEAGVVAACKKRKGQSPFA